MSKKDRRSEEDLAYPYNQFKTFEGGKYTGMKVGGRPTWCYEKGEWKEKKVALERARRRRLIQILRETIDDLRREPETPAEPTVAEGAPSGRRRGPEKVLWDERQENA